MMWPVIKPWALMAVSSCYLPITVVKLIAAGDFATLFSWQGFNDAWFGSFWVFMGPRSKAEAEKWVLPLLEGRTRGGSITTTEVNQPIEGVILEVGAGSGMWTQILANIIKSSNTASRKATTKIYGVEPNPISAAALKRRVDDVGLAGTYEVVPVGIEDLQKETSLGPSSVDCIITVQCLCSIPEPEKNVALLYEYLKYGGRWYVYEHIKAEDGLVIPIFQRFTNYFWECIMGSCHLCRSSLRTIANAGEWEHIDLARRSDESSWAVIPHVVGTLTKRKR
ncbi:hypothetical protein NW762_010130 [Fusarium torreyae]|uniref:Methyltransferase type 11 domain-containing protein n=1 Tax=Fusarium torreyae TaxID=1237075 RepID=A0A9W8RVJ0_9HYPO|nr:hypothetical protein NW762_010130 [Fusarium torreyae]